jgi:hypothetical protein
MLRVRLNNIVPKYSIPPVSRLLVEVPVVLLDPAIAGFGTEIT